LRARTVPSLHVDVPGTYIVQATWYNSTHTLPLDLRLNITTLPPGDHHLELWFSAMSATLFFQSGPFVVDFAGTPTGRALREVAGQLAATLFRR